MGGLAFAELGRVGGVARDGAGVGVDRRVAQRDDDARGPDVGGGVLVDGDEDAVLAGRVVAGAGELQDVALADECGESR